MFKNLTISKKIGLGFAIISALIAITVFTTYWKITKIEKIYLQITEEEVPVFAESMKLLNSLNESSSIVRRYVLAKDKKLYNRRQQIWEDGIKESFDKIQVISSKSANLIEASNLSIINKDLQRLNGLQEQALHLARTSKNIPAVDIIENETAPITAKLRATIEKIALNTSSKIEIDSKIDKEILWSLKSLLWLIFAFSILISTLLGTFLTKDITNTLSTEINSLRSASDQLKQASSDQLNSVTEQTAVTSQVSSTMKELNEMAKSVLKRCKDMASFADSAVDITADGRQAVHGAQNIMSEIKEQIEIIVRLMLNLGEKSQKIDVALKIIRELSEQTTILSYNAAIEAAAAGEAGQSFAVVADQVGKLAQRAKEASRDVKNSYRRNPTIH